MPYLIHGLLKLLLEALILLSLGCRSDMLHPLERLRQVALDLFRLIHDLTLLKGDNLAEIAPVLQFPIHDIVIVYFPHIRLLALVVNRPIPRHLVPVIHHPVALLLRYVALGGFRLFFRYKRLMSLFPLFLLGEEDVEEFFEVELELICVAFFGLFEGVHGDNVLAEAVLHFLSQHELFFIELEENLQVAKVLLVFLFLKFCGVSLHSELMLSGSLLIKNRLGSLCALPILQPDTLTPLLSQVD